MATADGGGVDSGADAGMRRAPNSGCGCVLASGSPQLGGLAGVLLALVVVGRRRRRR
jgi:MYXO-CTERM domain-containing protein